MNYGYFDDAAREYVITNPRTPVKWINYIGTLAFGGFVDHTGGACICKGDPSVNRITKYIQQMPSSDFKGETLYCRIGEKDRHTIISPFFVPGLDHLDKYECRVGLGYTRIVSELRGLRIDCLIFVPLDAHCELRDVRITNVSGKPIAVDAVPVVEYTHFDAVKQFTNADWVPQTMQSRCRTDKRGRRTLLQYAFMRRDTAVNFFTANVPASSFATDRKRFLGGNEYGTWARPLALEQDELDNYEANRGDNIAALLLRLGTIQPGQTRRFVTQLGQNGPLKKAVSSVARFYDGAAVDAAFAALKEFWLSYCAHFQVTTPDAGMNSMVNVHNPRQCFMTFNWSRYLSYYQLGLGTRGLGYRDSTQDVMAVVGTLPGEAKSLFTKLLSTQKRDGSAMHQFNPLTMEASCGDAAERDDRPRYYGDDHLWPILAVTAYVKETGDADFLDRQVPYYEKDKTGKPLEQGSVLDHLRRACAFTRGNLGPHGLPLLGFADWNDTVNLPTGAESIFNACLYGKALLEMIGLAGFLRDEKMAAQYRADYEAMKSSFNKHCWDGAWYIRYFDADGSPLGSKKNKQGKIYLNAQSWPVFAGFATPERGRLALDSARRLLGTKYGFKLSAPGFNGFDPHLGGVTTYPPGAKENGGIFLHTNPWVMIAEALLGNGNAAFDYYDRINPAKKNDKIDEYECEPYVYAQNILGDEHPQFGLGRNSWLSGTASWSYQAATGAILGIKPDYDGLAIDPCIPTAWDGFSATRRFRGSTYEIVVKNPLHVCRGVSSLVVNGKKLPGNKVPLFISGKLVTVEATLG